MSVDAFSEGIVYENFIKRAFNCPQGARNGARASFMQNAVNAEQGNNFSKKSGIADQQFEKVKEYVLKALIKYSKVSPYKKQAAYYLNIHADAEDCYSTECLMEVIWKAIKKANEIDGR